MSTFTIESGESYSRFFHSAESIENFLKSAGFELLHTESYEELLCIDFQRKIPAKRKDHLIELFASKVHHH